MPSKVLEGITYPFPNFNVAVEVWSGKSINQMKSTYLFRRCIKNSDFARPDGRRMGAFMWVLSLCFAFIAALSRAITSVLINTLGPRRNGRHFADDIFKCIFVNENVWIPIKISLNFVPKGAINNILALVQIMAWRRAGDKPLSEPMMVSLPTHICVTRPQWVKVKFELKHNNFIQENKLENVVCKLATIYLGLNMLTGNLPKQPTLHKLKFDASRRSWVTFPFRTL